MMILNTCGRRVGRQAAILNSLPRICYSSSTSCDKEVKTAHTVIIGGGAVGVSVAYHLAKLGQKDVVLLEKSELTAGSTWHAAGLTAFYQPTPNIKPIHYYSINLYSTLEKETGQEVGFHQPGSLRVATSPVRVDEMRYQMSRQGHKDAPQKILTPEEIQKICPILNMDIVLAGLYNPADGHIDPYSLTHALAKGARKYGARIHSPANVTGLNKRGQEGWDVILEDGTVIKSTNVVNAAGFWAKEVGKLAGLELPLIPMEHQYLITASIPAVSKLESEIPVLRHLDGSYYLRQERGGSLLIGPYESQETCKSREDWVKDGVPKGFGKELFPSDIDRLSPHLAAAMDLVPCVSDADIKTVVCGPITYTPDLLPMVGPSILSNMWLAVGFSYGIIHAGGFGRYLAEWILRKEPPCELIEVEPLRYGTWTNLPYIISKARESYGLNSSVTYPLEERFAGRPTSRTSGAYKRLLERGAHMKFNSGWEQPGWFAHSQKEAQYIPSFYRTNWHSAVTREYETVMKRVGIIDLTPFAKFLVSGKDSAKFLDYVTANIIPDSEDERNGKTCITHCLTSRGTVYAELTVTARGNGQYMVITGAGSEMHDIRWLLYHAEKQNFKVTINNITEETGCLGIAGPNSQQLLKKLCSSSDIEEFPFLTSRKIRIGEFEVIALRISYTGELGWELYCDQHNLGKLYSLLLEAGQELGVGDFGGLTMNVLRMEKGFRMWGADMNKDISPLEAGLSFFIRLNKGDFIGRKALLTEKSNGLKKHLVQLEVDTENVDPFGDETVWCSGKAVGFTTSGCFSRELKKPLAFAYVPPFLTKAGSSVQVDIVGTQWPARVITGPVMEPHHIRVQKSR